MKQNLSDPNRESEPNQKETLPKMATEQVSVNKVGSQINNVRSLFTNFAEFSVFKESERREGIQSVQSRPVPVSQMSLPGGSFMSP